MTLQVIIKDYQPNPTVYVLMMSVAGAAFGTNFIKPKNGNGKDGGDA